MRTLVTGGTGFIGTALCRELAERGHEVTALARNPDEADFDGVDVETAMGDVTAYDSIEPHFEDQDAVVNLVALSPLFRPKGGDERHFEVHLGGTENVVEAAESHGVPKVVQMSGVHADPDADTAYLQAKGQAEEVVRSSSLDWVIFRPTVVFGDGDELLPFVKTVATPYLTPLPGGGDQRFQLLYRGDLVPMLADATDGTAPEEPDAADASGSPDGAAAETDGGSESGATDDEGGDVEDTTDDEAADGDADAGDGDQDPHVGEVYEIGGPEVQPFSDVVRLIYGAENKPVTVVPVPLALADVGLSLLGSVGGPLGRDQAKSLRKDLVVAHNDIDAFGVSEDEMTTFAEYLGVDPEAVRARNERKEY